MNECAPRRKKPRTPRELHAVGLASPQPRSPSPPSIEPVDLPPADLHSAWHRDSRADVSNGEGKKIAEELLSCLYDEFDRLEKLNNKLWLENKFLHHQLEVAQRTKANILEIPEDTAISRHVRVAEFTPSPRSLLSSDAGGNRGWAKDDPTTRRIQGTLEANVEEANDWCECDTDSSAFQTSFRQSLRSDAAESSKTSRISWVFSSADDMQKSRSEKAGQLQVWFQRIKSNDAVGLSPYRLLNIVQHAYGVKNMISLEQIGDVIMQLQVRHEKSVGSEDVKPRTDLASELVLLFPAFVDLILFDRFGSVEGDTLQHAIVLRDALMRTHIHELVAEYSHTPVTEINEDIIDVRKVRLANFFDALVGFAIAANGFITGLSSDVSWEGWNAVEVAFTLFFSCEIGLKIAYYGCRNHFFGSDWGWNWFDAGIVGLGVMDGALWCLASSSDQRGLQNFNMARLARLARLTRILRLLRVLRLRIFKELLLMVRGVVAGLRTLFWAIAMLLVIVYGCGVMLRQTIGNDSHVMKDEYKTVLFGSVPWSMFTAFRCFTADCNLPDGTPIVGHLYELYGYGFVIPYALVFMFITFGVFNMVTAVFVETVMEAARNRQVMSKEMERIRVAGLLSRLVLLLAARPIDEFGDENSFQRSRGTISKAKTAFKSISENLRRSSWPELPDICSVSIASHVTRKAFIESLQNPEVVTLIDSLELNVADHSELFDILDADGSGTVDVTELISGVLKLRTMETKGDIVALILGMRDIRRMLKEMDSAILKQTEQIRYIRGSIKDKAKLLPNILRGRLYSK